MKIQTANATYINKTLNKPLHQMMIATLNQMPEEPAQHMKDYIGLHYFYEQKPAITEMTPLTDAEKRKGLRVKDLEDLRVECNRLRIEKDKFTALKTAFHTINKDMNEISADS